MELTNHYENQIGLSNITEIKRETVMVEKIIELRISELGFWRCLCFINTTITKSIQYYSTRVLQYYSTIQYYSDKTLKNWWRSLRWLNHSLHCTSETKAMKAMVSICSAGWQAFKEEISCNKICQNLPSNLKEEPPFRQDY